ncbi:MAG: tetratricopeptide repeat protein [Pyrinomonadaceae bacterium]
MFLRGRSIRIFFAAFFSLCAALPAFAQGGDNSSAELVKFEKSIEAGKFSEIERNLLDYAIAHPKEAKAFELLGRIRFRQNRLNEAKSLFTRALTLEPGLTSARLKLAETTDLLGDRDAARSLLENISETALTSDEVRLKLAEIYFSLEDCPKALVVAEKLSPSIKDSRALAMRAGCLIKSGDRAGAGGLIVPAGKLGKSEMDSVLELAEVFIESGMPKEAAELLETAVVKDPVNERALILLARSKIYLKDPATAEKQIAQIEKLNPASDELLLIKGLLDLEREKPSEALGLFEKYLALKPASTDALSQAVIAAIRSNQAGKAVDLAEDLLRLKPGEPEYLYLHGAASLQAGRLPEAERSLTEFLRTRPDDARGCLALGLTFAAQPDKLETARDQLRQCLEKNPDNYEARYQLGLSYKTQGETAKAIGYLEEVVAQKGDYAAALRDLGTVYLQSGAETKARAALEKAVALDPQDAETHFQLSRLYNLIGETELAKKHLKIFQELKNPKRTLM